MFADDLKVLTINNNEIPRNAELLSEWCADNLISCYKDKCKILCIKGAAPVASLQSTEISTVDNQKDLGFLEHGSNWSLFAVKRNTSSRLSITTKLNIYCGYIMPYSSQIWYANKGVSRVVEHVQQIATRWIVGSELNYKERLLKLKLLPASLYLEMHDLLLLSSFISGSYEADWHEYVSFANDVSTRRSARTLFDVETPRQSRYQQNFWYRAPKLANMIGSLVDFFETTGLKQRLTNLYWNYFISSYEHGNSCTWTIFCWCTSCINSTNYRLGLVN